MIERMSKKELIDCPNHDRNKPDCDCWAVIEASIWTELTLGFKELRDQYEEDGNLADHVYQGYKGNDPMLEAERTLTFGTEDQAQELKAEIILAAWGHGLSVEVKVGNSKTTVYVGPPRIPKIRGNRATRTPITDKMRPLIDHQFAEKKLGGGDK